MRLWTRAILVTALAASTGALGCAEEREPINRTQANILAKSFFVGDLEDDSDNPEFWTQGTLIDVGYGAAQDGLFTSTYAQPVSRIKWQITEDYLIGRLAYERIDGSDGKKGLGKSKGIGEGDIAYIYPILSHFDLRRDYNPTTGEETNVIVENTSDRRWNQREYFRVDWSRNLNTDAFDYDTLSLMGIYGGVSYEPVSYYVNDPKHEDAPVFDAKDGYFDVTNKALATPGLIDLSHLGWGIDSFPACYLDADFFSGTAPAGSCNPIELTIRQSFRKVVDEDFEPQDWDGYRFQAFGAFTADRSGYAQNYGMVDEKWHRFIARYNIWERSHYYSDPENMTGAIECNTPDTTPYGADPHRDVGGPDINGDGVPDGNGTEDECEKVTELTGVAGSRCDEFTQKCTLPYQKRTSKPIVWNYTKNSNQDVFEGTEWAAHEWDVATRVAIQAAKYAECTKTKTVQDGDGDGMDDACHEKFPVYNGQQEENEDAIALAHEVDLCRHKSNPALVAPDDREAADEECQAIADSIGKKRGYSDGVIAIAKMPEAVVLCHGPVEANDPIACGELEARLPAGVTAADCDAEWNSDEPDQEIVSTCEAAHFVRIGDLRYHQINAIKIPQTPSPWGIMTDSVDPTNGNKVAASINIWTHVNSLFSQGVVDLVRYIQGELPTEDITDGKYINDWAAASSAAAKNGAAGMFTRDERDVRVAQMAWQATRTPQQAFTQDMPSKEELLAMVRGTDRAPQVRQDTRAAMQSVIDKVRATKASPTAPSQNRAIYEQRRRQVQDTPTEAAVLTPAMQQLAGVDQAAGVPEFMKTEFSSIFRGLNPMIRDDIRQAKENALAARGACIMQEAPAPNSIASLGEVLRAKFGNWQDIDPNDTNARHDLFERMRLYLAQRAQYAVIIHEMGHSMGLRHNFVSSSNAFNYRPQYWQLRTKNGKLGQLDASGNPVNPADFCDDLASDGNSCIGPRYFDPPTDEESSQLIHMFMQSSVMDYAGETTQDLIGLGAYDFASVRSFYGDVLSVYADQSFNIDQPRGSALVRTQLDTFGGIIGYQYEEPAVLAGATSGEGLHYSKLQSRYNLIQDCHPIEAADFQPSDWDEAKQGRWSPLLDGGLVAIDGAYSRCRTQKVDYVNHARMRRPVSGTEGNQYNLPGQGIDPYKRTRVPYAFASDNWADLGNLAVYRHDNGADPYELFNFFITEQETRHIFDNYRRGRQSFSVRSAANRILDRYNSKMRDGAKGLGLFFNLYRDLLGASYDNTLSLIADPDGYGWGDNMLASGIAFDHFTRQIQRPESGPHLMFGGVLESMDKTINTNAPLLVNVPDGATGYFGNVAYGGKLLENQLSDDNGDYDSNYTVNAGSYYDKVYAPYLLTESVDNFISDSIDDFVDARYRSVSMTDMFPVGFRRMLGNMLTYDENIKGAALAAADSGNPLVDFQSKFPTKPLGWTTFWSSEPEVCFPGQTGIACSAPGNEGEFFGGDDITSIVHVSSNVDWEAWKFLLIQTMLYLPENAKNTWVNDLGLWEVGADTDPGFANRIEFHSPDGRTYIARANGSEMIFGKRVEKGIGARMLQQANELLIATYRNFDVYGPGAACTDDCTLDTDADGVADAVAGVLDANGKVVSTNGTWWVVPIADETGDYGNPKSSAALAKYNDYEPLLTFVRQTLQDFRMADPTMKGIYD